MRIIIFGCFLYLISACTSCYSFRGTSIPPEVNTFYVPNFTLESYEVPANLANDISEKLRLKIRNESRLKYNENEPDIEFVGKILDFKISPVAPQNNGQPAANRLEITVTVDYIDHKNTKNNWHNNFSFFKDYGIEQNFLDVRDQLANQIFDQLSEDIFNKAFSNW